MAKRKPIKKKSKAPQKRVFHTVVRRYDKNDNPYFYNKKKGKITSRKLWREERKKAKKKYAQAVKRKVAPQKQVVKPVKKLRPSPIPRKGTVNYKKWLKRYRHLRKCSKARAIAYDLYPEIFPTYASTAAFCSFFLKKKVRLTLNNIDEAVKEYAKTIAKPDIPERLLQPWFWFEADFRSDELRQYVVENLINNLWIRSQLSSMPAFLINEYTYDSTFKEYVDWKNAQQDPNRDQGRDYTELLVSLHFNDKKARWEIFVQEEDNPGGENYVPKIPYDILIKEEPKEIEGPIVAKGGPEKPKTKKRVKRKAKKQKVKTETQKSRLSKQEMNERVENLVTIRNTLNQSITQLGQEMRTYRETDQQELLSQVTTQIKEVRKQIDEINRQIVNLKTMEKGG